MYRPATSAPPSARRAVLPRRIAPSSPRGGPIHRGADRLGALLATTLFAACSSPVVQDAAVRDTGADRTESAIVDSADVVSDADPTMDVTGAAVDASDVPLDEGDDLVDAIDAPDATDTIDAADTIDAPDATDTVDAPDATDTVDDGGSDAPCTSACPIAVGLAAGGGFTCAWLDDGTARCWGSNLYGQIGDTIGPQATRPIRVPGLASVDLMGSGAAHVCASSTGTAPAMCWGRNDNGEVGDGTTTTSRPAPTLVPSLTGVSRLALGNAHSCAVLADHTAVCWGANDDGQIGDGGTTMALTPTPVRGLTGVVDIATGYRHTCAVLDDGTARCWGYNGRAQLGDGTLTSRTLPVPVRLLTGATQISAGTNHTCVRIADGTARCWGENPSGQLGDGTMATRTTSVQVSGLDNVAQIDAGGSHTCARRTDGTLRCWGANLSGQLGDGTRGPSATRLLPVVVVGIADAAELSAGGSHTCTRSIDGVVRCWGDNTAGQLGDGTTTSRATPVVVSPW